MIFLSYYSQIWMLRADMILQQVQTCNFFMAQRAIMCFWRFSISRNMFFNVIYNHMITHQKLVIGFKVTIRTVEKVTVVWDQFIVFFVKIKHGVDLESTRPSLDLTLVCSSRSWSYSLLCIQSWFPLIFKETGMIFFSYDNSISIVKRTKKKDF